MIVFVAESTTTRFRFQLADWMLSTWAKPLTAYPIPYQQHVQKSADQKITPIGLAVELYLYSDYSLWMPHVFLYFFFYENKNEFDKIKTAI